MKKYRRLIQFGTFYRIKSPFVHNEASWMVVSEDKKQAIVGFYRTLSRVNYHFSRIRLQGLDPDLSYSVNGKGSHYGDELMYNGLVVSDGTSGKTGEDIVPPSDFFSQLFLLTAEEKETNS